MHELSTHGVWGELQHLVYAPLFQRGKAGWVRNPDDLTDMGKDSRNPFVVSDDGWQGRGRGLGELLNSFKELVAWAGIC